MYISVYSQKHKTMEIMFVILPKNGCEFLHYVGSKPMRKDIKKQRLVSAIPLLDASIGSFLLFLLPTGFSLHPQMIV